MSGKRVKVHRGVCVGEETVPSFFPFLLGGFPLGHLDENRIRAASFQLGNLI